MLSSTNMRPAEGSTLRTSPVEGSAERPLQGRYLTVPNLICFARIILSFGLIWLAVNGHNVAFVVSFVVLSLSDFIDGRIARWLNQHSDFGARLDSASDSILYLCLIIGSIILKPDVLWNESIWLAVALASYALTTSYGLWKYGKVPSYHTYAAKKTQWLVLFGAIALLLDWSVWPMRIAAIAGTLTNLEATAMTYVLPEWKADVLSIFKVLPKRSDDFQG